MSWTQKPRGMVGYVDGEPVPIGARKQTARRYQTAVKRIKAALSGARKALKFKDCATCRGRFFEAEREIDEAMRELNEQAGNVTRT